MQQRYNELISLPIDLPSELKRKALIELKQLKLVELQKKIRAEIAKRMRKTVELETSINSKNKCFLFFL